MFFISTFGKGIGQFHIASSENNIVRFCPILVLGVDNTVPRHTADRC